MSRHQKARILVIEDDELIRMSVEASLQDKGYLVQVEAGGAEFHHVLERFRPDLAILDVNLPEGPDGLTIARRIRVESDIPILFLTSADAVSDRLAGFEAGADDYLVKPFDMEELLARIHVLLRRAGRLSSAVWQVGDLLVDDNSRSVFRDEESVELTPTEYELLLVFVHHRGQVLSRSQLLNQVWGFDPIYSNMLNVHLSSLRRKLEEHGPRLIHTIRGVGWVLRAEAGDHD